MSFAIVYENFADQAVLAGGSWAMPLTNAQDPDIGFIARSTSATAASTQFTVNLGSAQPIGGLALGPANLTPGATYRMRGYIDAAMTSLAYDSGLKALQGNVVDWANPATWLEYEDPNFWSGIVPTDVGELPLYLTHLIPPTSAPLAQAQFWKIEISNPDNPDGYVQFGRLLMGRVYRPSYNYAYEGNDFGIEPLVDITESLGGSEAYWERGLRRTFRASWPLLSETEVFDAWVRIMLRAGISRQVFVIPEETDSEEQQRKRAFLARFKSTPRIAQSVFLRAATSIDVQEIL